MKKCKEGGTQRRRGDWQESASRALGKFRRQLAALGSDPPLPPSGWAHALGRGRLCDDARVQRRLQNGYRSVTDHAQGRLGLLQTLVSWHFPSSPRRCALEPRRSVPCRRRRLFPVRSECILSGRTTALLAAVVVALDQAACRLGRRSDRRRGPDRELLGLWRRVDDFRLDRAVRRRSLPISHSLEADTRATRPHLECTPQR